MAKPIIRKGVASGYEAPGESIYDITSEAGGGLIRLIVVKGRLRVELYRLDPTVDVVTPTSKKLGDMTPAERAAVIERAAAILQRELSHPAFAHALDEAERAALEAEPAQEEASGDADPE